MIRRQARQRRDYLFRRALTLKDAEIAQKRAKLKASLASGKPLAPEIANDKALRRDYRFDESRADRTAEDELELDDEYAHLSGVVDPRVLVSTSRDPSARLSSFAKEIRLLLPTAIRLNRGNAVLPMLVSSANSSGLSDIVILHEHRGTPTALTVSHLPHGPTASFSLHNVMLRHDIRDSARGTVSESYPHLIFDGFQTKLGKRVVKILQHLFPPREGKGKVGSRVVTFKNIDDSIEVRHHVFVRTGYKSVELAEVGPRMTMRLFEIRGGTLENRDGDVELLAGTWRAPSNGWSHVLVGQRRRPERQFGCLTIAVLVSMAATEPAQRDPQPTDPDSGSGSGSSSGPASGPGSILWPALRVGTISGIGGVAFGSVTGLIRSSSPTLFGLFSGAQCFSLGATFWGFRGFIFRYRYRSQPDPPLREKVLMSSMAGGLAGGSLGFILRGRANVVPGAIMFSIFGAGTQGLISYLSRGPSPESVNKAPLLQRIARSKWSPMKILSDEEYLAMLEQKLSRVDAEVAVMDEKIRALRQESEEYHRNAAIRDESNKN